MSKPTIIMITHAAGDDGLDRLNASLVDKIGISGQVTRVDSIAKDWDAATAVHIGSFNHLDEPEFMRLVREANWKESDQLQVFIEREDDWAFTEYDLFDRILPMQIAERAIGRGVGLSMPTQQRAFLERLGSCPSEIVDTETPWMFEVVTIRQGYYLEANARVVSCGKSTAIGTSAFRVKPVDLAMEGIGVRWGSNDLNILNYANEETEKIIRELSPGDRVKVEGRIRTEPSGILTLYEVRSLSKISSD